MSLINDVSAAKAAVQDMIDLDMATDDPSVSPQLRRRLTRAAPALVAPASPPGRVAAFGG